VFGVATTGSTRHHAQAARIGAVPYDLALAAGDGDGEVTNPSHPPGGGREESRHKGRPTRVTVTGEDVAARPQLSVATAVIA
jgi:hypothetical protein